MNSVAKLQKRPFDEDSLRLSSSAKATSKLRALVRDGWHQDPSVRPTATEMRERLERIVADVETVDTPAASKHGARSAAGSSPRGVDAVASSKPYSYLYPERRANRHASATMTVYNGDVFFDAA